MAHCPSEGFQDVAKSAEIGLGFVATDFDWHEINFGVFIGGGNLDRLLFLYVVTVHIDRFKDATG